MSSDPKKNWIKRVNDETGQPVYFNAHSWMPAAKVPASEVNNIWEERYDPKYKRAFYWNPATNQSKWSLKPEAQAVKRPDNAESAPTKPPVNPPPNSPKGEWREVWDEETERTFWFNEVTHESLWIKPTGDSVVLDNPWQEMKDEKTGRVYYYNARSGISQWEKPIPKLPAAARPSEKELEETGGDIREEGEEVTRESERRETVDDLEELPWEMLRDPSTGRVYFFNRNDGRSQWERPADLPALDEDGPADSEGEFVDPSASPPAKAPTGEAWEALVDPDSGKTYYFNKNTGVSRWTDPHAPPLVPPLPPEKPPEAKPPDEPVVAPPKKPKEELEGPWTEVYDDKHKRVYYYNTETGESQWIHPMAQRPPVTAKSSLKKMLDPENIWIEMEDEQTSRIYFYNKLTGESRWTLPQVQSSPLAEAKMQTTLDAELSARPTSSVEASPERSTQTSELASLVEHKPGSHSVLPPIPDELLPDNVFSMAEEVVKEKRQQRTSVVSTQSEASFFGDSPLPLRSNLRQEQERERTLSTMGRRGFIGSEPSISSTPLGGRRESVRTSVRDHRRSVGSAASTRSAFDPRYSQHGALGEVDVPIPMESGQFLLSGWLEKRSRNGYQWHQRYFALGPAALVYYKDEPAGAEDEDPLGIIDLKQVRAVEPIDGTRNVSSTASVSSFHNGDLQDGTDFRILGIGTIGILCILRAESISARKSWMQAISEAIISSDVGPGYPPGPASLVSSVSHRGMGSPPQQKMPTHVRCIKGYIAEGEGELSFLQGDMIRVLEAPKNSPWWIGQLKGKFGRFLKSHVSEVKSKSSPTRLGQPPVKRIEHALRASSVGGEPMPTMELIAELAEQVARMNARNHKLKAEVNGIKWMIEHNKWEDAQLASVRRASPALVSNAERLSMLVELLSALQKEPRFLVLVGSMLKNEGQAAFASTITNSLLDSVSSPPQLFLEVVKDALGLAQLELCTGLLQAFLERRECRTYMRNVLSPAMTHLRMILEDAERGSLSIAVASERIVSTVVDTVGSESGVKVLPLGLLAVVQLLTISGGTKYVKDFIFDSLLPQLLVENALDDGTQTNTLFQRCKKDLDDGGLQRAVDNLVTQFIEAASLADPSIDHVNKAPEICDHVVISCFELYLLHMSVYNYVQRSRLAEGCSKQILEIIRRLGRPSPLRDSEAGNPYVVLFLQADNRVSSGLDENTVSLLFKAGEVVNSADRFHPQEVEELAEDLSRAQGNIEESVNRHRSLLRSRKLVQEYFSDLVLERDDLLERIRNGGRLNGRSEKPILLPIGGDTGAHDKDIGEPIRTLSGKLELEQTNQESSTEEKQSSLQNLLATVYSPLKLDSI